jgi:hypothetical protein
MVVHAQVQRRIRFGRAYTQRRRLPAALVAACGFPGLHRRDQALGERSLARGCVSLGGLSDHFRA